MKFDETFKREVETYRGRLLVELPLADGPPAGQVTVSVAVVDCSCESVTLTLFAFATTPDGDTVPGPVRLIVVVVPAGAAMPFAS